MNVIETRPQSLAWDAVKAGPAYGLDGDRRKGGASSVQAPVWNLGTPRPDTVGRVLERSARGSSPSSGNCEGLSTDAGQAGGPSCSSDEAW